MNLYINYKKMFQLRILSEQIRIFVYLHKIYMLNDIINMEHSYYGGSSCI